MGNKLIVNKMYAGGYLNQNVNIGHEVINFMPGFDIDGNKKYFIWLNPGGTVDKGKIKPDDKVDILYIRYISKNIHKVIGIARDCKVDPSAQICGNDDNLKKNRYEKQKDSAKYNLFGKEFYIKDLFSSNVYKDQSDKENTLYSFVSEKIEIPKIDMYIVNIKKDKKTRKNEVEKYKRLIDNKFFFKSPYTAKEQLRQYINNPDEFKFIKSNSGFWKKYKFDEDKYKRNDRNINVNFYSLIQKENDENIASNSIYYFLEKYNLTNKFFNYLGDVVDTDIKCDKTLDVLREEFNVDLLFYNEKNVFIVENKIKAGINGEKKFKNDKLLFKAEILDVTKKYMARYYDVDDKKIVNKRVKEICNHIANDLNKKWSQLSKYYIFAINYLLDKGIDIKDVEKHIYSFILYPNYREYEMKVLLYDDYAFYDKYQHITYKVLKKFFEDNHIDDIYYKDFLQLLDIHSKDCNDDLETTMYQRLCDKIINDL